VWFSWKENGVVHSFGLNDQKGHQENHFDAQEGDGDETLVLPKELNGNRDLDIKPLFLKLVNLVGRRGWGHFDKALDIAIFRHRSRRCEVPFSFTFSSWLFSSENLKKTQEVNIIGYSGGEVSPEQFGVKGPIISLFNFQIFHGCEMRPGSSGSPVLDSMGTLIGVHRAGISNEGVGIFAAATRLDHLFAYEFGYILPGREYLPRRADLRLRDGLKDELMRNNSSVSGNEEPEMDVQQHSSNSSISEEKGLQGVNVYQEIERMVE